MVVRHLTGEADDCRRLREMGFQEDTALNMVCAGGAVIVQVRGTKVCLSRRMADSVLVGGAGEL